MGRVRLGKMLPKRMPRGGARMGIDEGILELLQNLIEKDGCHGVGTKDRTTY